MASALHTRSALLTTTLTTGWRSPLALGKISLPHESNPSARQENAHGQVYYIGSDAHTSSCTVAVVGPSSRRLTSQVVETNARALVSAIEAIPKSRHLRLEEGALAGWLYEMLAPHVQEIIITAVPQSRGPKSDKRDAFGLAEMLRIGAIPRKVYKQRGRFTQLAYLAKAYQMLVSDDVRVQNRIKSLLRSRGIQVAGSAVYTADGRSAYVDRLPVEATTTADLLCQQHDHLSDLRKQAQREMFAEARKHSEYRCVKSCPGLGEVRAALLWPVVITPYRFANKRQFWAYCGLASRWASFEQRFLGDLPRTSTCAVSSKQSAPSAIAWPRCRLRASSRSSINCERAAWS